MGYTNYWRRPTELKTIPFAKAVEDCTLALKSLSAELAGRDGNGLPLFAPDHIAFNGRVPRSQEAFEIARVEFDRHGKPEFYSFCKTALLPYDLAVKVCLIILAHHLGDAITVTSDAPQDSWNKAKLIVIDALGYGGEFQPEDSC